MKIYVLTTIFLIAFSSCKRWKYEEVKIHGKVINGCLGVPMPGEQVSLFQVKGEFLGPGNGSVIKTVTTNANGEFDFGGVDLRKKDKYSYYVQYVHRGITSDGYCDFFEVEKTAIDQNKNLVVFVGGGIVFQVVPDMSVVGTNDSLKVKIQTSVEYSLFYCNPNAAQDYANKKNAVLNKDSFLSNGKGGPFYGGNAYYFLEIDKTKSGVSTIIYDTVLVSGSLTYSILW